MTPKFEVGNIVRTEDRTRWPKVIEITGERGSSYTVRILCTLDNFKQEIGMMYTFPKVIIDQLWELDPSYLAKEQFDKELKELLK